jgi:hypothetical protein
MRKIAVLMTVLGLLAGALLAGLLLRPAKQTLLPSPSCSEAAVILVNQKVDSGAVLAADMLSVTTVRHELMLGDLIGEDVAEFIAGLPLKNSLRRGDLLRWSDFDSQAILEAAATPDKVAPRKTYAVFTKGQILPSTPIRSYNAASRRDEKYFDCMVFLSGPAAVLDQVECVEYTLHETFDNPRRKVCRPEADPNFSLSFSAWGTFDIPVKVTMKGGAQMEWLHGLHF